MLLNAIATIILAGMMLIPLVNVFVGAVVGAALGGVPGALAGVALAVAITLAERLIVERRGVRSKPRASLVAEEAVVTTRGRRARTGSTETPRTRPPRHRGRAHRAREVRERPAHAISARQGQTGSRG